MPDVLLLADADVFPRFLVPNTRRGTPIRAQSDGRRLHATSRSTPTRSPPANWTRSLQRNDVEIGRTDPNLAPSAIARCCMFELAERYYKTPGLAASLLAHAPERNIRPNAAELAALLAAGELDYIYDYQSVAESNGFRVHRAAARRSTSATRTRRGLRDGSVEVRGTAPRHDERRSTVSRFSMA